MFICSYHTINRDKNFNDFVYVADTNIYNVRI